MRSPIIFRIFKGSQLVEVKQFEADQVIFGHDAEVTVDLDDPAVSAIHCLLELRDSGYYVCDMGSATGTKKNGKTILDEAISSGDSLEIGPFRIQFFIGAPKPKIKPVEIPNPIEAEEPEEVTQAPGSKPTAPVNAQPQNSQVPPTIPAAPIINHSGKSKSPRIPAQGPTGGTATEVTSTRAAVSSKPPEGRPSEPKPKLPDAQIPPVPKKASAKERAAQGTYAPPSEITNLSEYLRPTKGPVVEVIVAWHERIIDTYHFGGDATVNIGSSSICEVKVPATFIKGALPLLDLKGGCRVLAPQEISVSVTALNNGKFSLDDMLKSGKALKAGAAHAIRMDQGELVCLSFANGALQVFVRYVANTVKPALAMPLDFTAGELTGMIVALVIVALTALYMSVYTPEAPIEKEEEQVRLAQFVYNKPSTTTLPPTPTTTIPPVAVQTPPTTTVPPPPPEPVKVKVTDIKKEATQKGKKDSVAATKEVEKAKAAEVRPNPSKVDRPKKFTSIKQGGATKLGETAGANAQSAKDVTKVGLLGAFGGGGVRKTLDQAYSGSGELLGLANQATGKTGQNESREGDDIGSKFKDTGAGGKGTATQGIAGVGTKGRGSGMSAYGGGVGLGGKGNVTIDAGGAEEGWEGTIDREAVRRVIKSILSQIKSCYERELRVRKGLEGKVVIQFEIMEQGRVRTAKTKSSSMGNPTVESCVAARIREARFPEPPPGSVAVVDYPFVFGAQD